MKIKLIFIVLFAFTASGLFLSCDNEGKIYPDSALYGKWELVESSIYGGQGTQKDAPGTIQEFKSDGTYHIDYPDRESFKSEYTLESGVVYFGVPGNRTAIKFTIKGNKLYETYDYSETEGAWCLVGFYETAVWKRVD
ncbi:hypothetical protein [Bacteroides sp. 519]|uniref:hypothetical protein n=1 Tax=Bacteroides sp. 519 TaxID=2302937 RepID=UPI0013D634C4|nr:hypothetical protein [Bacteroides sp. 519]NDV57558.1 hypothetical protein [Bacteroides sp. 519]